MRPGVKKGVRKGTGVVVFGIWPCAVATKCEETLGCSSQRQMGGVGVGRSQLDLYWDYPILLVMFNPSIIRSKTLMFDPLGVSLF